MTLTIGDRFAVAHPQELKDAKGRILARYLPDLDYAVTPHNLAFAAGLEAQGEASKFTGPARHAPAFDTPARGARGKTGSVRGAVGGVINTGKVK